MSEQTDKRRADILKGAKALGNNPVEVRGDYVAEVIKPGTDPELAKKAKDAGKTPILIADASRLAKAIEGDGSTPAIENKPAPPANGPKK